MDKIFGVKDSDESEIIKKISASGPEYLYNCYVELNKLQSHDEKYIDIKTNLLNYHKLFISGIILDNSYETIKKYINFIEKYNNLLWIELAKNSTDDEVLEYLKSFLPVCEKSKDKYKLLASLFEPEKVLQVFKNFPFYKTGKENEKMGLLSYFLNDISIDMALKKRSDILDNVYKSMRFILTDEKAFSDMIMLLQKLLLQNTSNIYTELMQPSTTCSSIDFISNIIELISRMWMNYNDKTDFKMNDKREDCFEIRNDDPLNMKLITLVGLSLHVGYHSLTRKYQICVAQLTAIDEELQGLDEFFLDSIRRPALLTSRKSISNKVNQLEKIIKSSELNTYIVNYFCTIIDLTNNKKYYIGEDIINDILSFVLHLMESYEIYCIDRKIINFIAEVMGTTTYTKNPHMRYECATIVHTVINRESPSCVNNNTISLLINYISDVDIFHINKPSIVHKHLMNILTAINNLLPIYGYDFTNFSSMKFLYKLFKEETEIIDDFINMSKILASENITGLALQAYKKRYDPRADLEFEFIESVISFFKCMVLKKYLILKNLTPETLNMVMIATLNTLTFLSNRQEKFIEIHTKYKARLKLIKIIFEVYILCTDYPEFINNLSNNKDLLVRSYDFLKDYKLLYGASELLPVSNFIDKLSSKSKTETEEKKIIIPDEFIDPILCCPITDPIMIPEVVDTIFDKTSIMTQLLNEPKNPYTRNPLTPEMLEEYNKKNEVQKKIHEFNEKFQKWKESISKENPTNKKNIS